MRPRSLVLFFILLAPSVLAAGPSVTGVAPLGQVPTAGIVLHALFSSDVLPGATTFRLDGDLVETTTSTASEASADVGDLTAGPHTAEVSVRDAEGRIANRTWSFIARAPAQTARIVAVGFAGGVVSSLPPIPIVYEGGSATVYVDGEPVPFESEEGRGILTLRGLADGDHTLLVVAEQEGVDRRSIPFRLDTRAPRVAFVDTSALPGEVSVSWTDESGIRPGSLRITLDGTSRDDLGGSVGADGGTLPLPPDLERGVHTLFVNVTDVAGNLGSGQQDFFVETDPDTALHDAPPAPDRSAPTPAAGGVAAFGAVAAAALLGGAASGRHRLR